MRPALTLVIVLACLVLPGVVYGISLKAELASARRHSERAAGARTALVRDALEKIRDSLLALDGLRAGSGSMPSDEFNGFAQSLFTSNAAVRAIGWVDKGDDGEYRTAKLRSRHEGEVLACQLPLRAHALLGTAQPGDTAAVVMPRQHHDPVFAGSMIVFTLPATTGRDTTAFVPLMCAIDLKEFGRILSRQWDLWPMETHLFHASRGQSPEWLFSVGVDGAPVSMEGMGRDSPLGEVHAAEFDFCGLRLSAVSLPRKELLDEHLTWQPLGATVGAALLVVLGFTYTGFLSRFNRRLRASMADLIQSERKAAQFLEAAPEAMIVADSARRICMLNHQAELLFGYTETEMTGLCVCALFKAPGREHVACPLSEGIGGERGASQTLEMRGYRKGGGTFPASVSVRAIDVGKGETVLCAAIRDETEAKEAQESMMMVAEQLASSNAELADFASVASHDLQEPLRQVISYLQLIDGRMAEDFDEDTRQFMDYAHEGAIRMSEFIEELLEYTRIGCKRGLPTGPADTTQVIEKVAASLRLTLEAGDANLSWDRLPVVKGDARQLEQLFANLISNALKYHGESPPRIEISARRQGPVWEFAVRDNGIGIDPAYHERIFEMFERLHGYGKYKGTGIGLATCRKIVENSGGRIWVESEEGRGATFRFTLPAGDPEERAGSTETGSEDLPVPAGPYR